MYIHILLSHEKKNITNNTCKKLYNLYKYRKNSIKTIILCPRTVNENTQKTKKLAPTRLARSEAEEALKYWAFPCNCI